MQVSKVNELAVNGTYIMSVDSMFASHFAQCMQYEVICDYMYLIYLSSCTKNHHITE